MTIPKAPQVFPRSEFLRRVSAVKAQMAKQGVETLVVINIKNIIYLTGYTAKSAYVPQGVIVSASREEPIFIMRQCDWPAALHQAWMARDNIIMYPESLIGVAGQDGFDAVIDYLIDLGVSKHAIGMELNDLNVNQVAKFERRLPNAKFVDCAKLVHWVRGVKSDAEIALMREAAAIADAAIQRTVETMRVGVRESEVAAGIYEVLARGADGKPGTDMTNSVFFCTSPRTGTCHLRWSEDVFQVGSQLNLELGGMRHAYVSAIMRTFILGKPSDRLRRMHEAEVEGMEAALAAVKPGRTCHDVAKAFYDTLARHGLKKDSRCGYGIGIEWLEPTASLQLGDTTILQPNQTFHLMLGNWVDEDFGYVISDTFRVTETGSEVFGKTPRSLFELPV